MNSQTVDVENIHMETFPTLNGREVVLKRLKNNKTPELDILPAELLKYGGEPITY